MKGGLEAQLAIPTTSASSVLGVQQIFVMIAGTKFGGVFWRKLVLCLCMGGRQANWGDG